MESDRRKYARIATSQVISFAQLDETDHRAVGRDISVGGIRFEAVGCEINLGEVLRLSFNLDGETVVAVGRVAWATELDPITLDVGIEFVEIDPRTARLLDEFADR
ncbi:MAG: PilZ domain-containing protein [Myxococcota bacterium]|nr:PilZ domain-containing protein [Myxococcota bacterium]